MSSVTDIAESGATSWLSGGLTNSGTMPISANGGAAGDATSRLSSDFKVGDLNMGGGSTSNSIVVAVVAAACVYFLMKKLK
jgi:hypothetical protein